jgi:tricorn protease-like protein
MRPNLTIARSLLMLGALAIAGACRDGTAPVSPVLPTTPSLAKGGPNALPVNGRIYFTSDFTGNFDVYSMKADGSDRRRLTLTGDNESFVGVSRDGKKLVVGSFRNNPAGADLITMNVDGTNRRVILSEAGDIIFGWAAFSPDGRTIAFASNLGNAGSVYSIWTVSVNGGKPTRLTQSTEVAAFPSWSPDGSRIMYSRGPIGTLGEDLYTMNADGSDQALFYDCTDACYYPNWSPDGSQIVYIKALNGALTIERCQSQNQCGFPIPHAGYPASLALSPDGSQFVTGSYDVNDLSILRIHTSNANGSGQAAVTANLMTIGTVAWGR